MTHRSNFTGLNKPNSPGFLDELDNYSTSLTVKDSQPFFELLLTLFQTSQMNKNVGNEILLTIYQLLENPKFKRQFILGEMISLLPFESPKGGINNDYLDNILNILSSLTSDQQSIPQILQTYVLKSISSYSPYKTIILISKIVQKLPIEDLYSSYPNEEEDDKSSSQWASFLIENNAFYSDDCVTNYISLLLRLLDNTDFCADYISVIWTTIVNLTSENYDVKTINIFYFSLCYLIDEKNYTSGTIRGDDIAEDLLNPNLKKSVLSLLLRCKLSTGVTEELVNALLKIAQTDPKALLVLNRVAETQKGALYLIQESSWMATKLPDIQSTLDLFLVLFTQPYLKKKIMAKTKDVVNFLNLVLSIPADLAPQGNKRSRDQAGKNLDAEIIPILCTILRRMEPTEKLISEMSEQNFLNEYLLRCDRSELHFYGIHLISQIVNAQIYTEELLTACDILISIIEADEPGRDYDFAITTAKEMCIFKQCRRRFKTSKIDQFIKNGDELTKLQKSFLRELNGTV